MPCSEIARICLQSGPGLSWKRESRTRCLRAVEEAIMPNRLATETSPYLLQHAENPVDWYPWGDEALRRAKAEDKPILVSVGYFACHWCHVMERESFENEEIAGVMNQHFINVKIDREERPDLDASFMEVVQRITGQGGWPLTVFLTPDGEPYYGGTYFPPDDRRGMPGFRRVLLAVVDAYRSRRAEVTEATRQIRSDLAATRARGGARGSLGEDVLSQAYQSLATDFDSSHGGFGSAPKFPQPMVLEFLMRYWLRSGLAQPLQMVELTLQKMAAGGIYDQIGGGFHRYSTDALWLVPHFEKMLYDNALLSRIYLHAYQSTRNPLYRRVVEETLDYVLREMTSPAGAFYTSQDADTEGLEGKFYTWTPGELAASLNPSGDNYNSSGDRHRIARRYFGVTDRGHLVGRSVLHVDVDPTIPAGDEGLSVRDASPLLQEIRAVLYDTRAQRAKPGRDEKVLTGWNGLMMRSFAEAGATFRRVD